MDWCQFNSFWKYSDAMDAAVGTGCSVIAIREGFFDGMFGWWAADAFVGEEPNVDDEECRDRLGRGEVDAPRLERSDAVDERFFRLGEDLRRSSAKELELGMRRGAECAELATARAGGSEGDSREADEKPDGDGGRGVACFEG